jgi:hypothetical protein
MRTQKKVLWEFVFVRTSHKVLWEFGIPACKVLVPRIAPILGPFPTHRNPWRFIFKSVFGSMLTECKISQGIFRGKKKQPDKHRHSVFQKILEPVLFSCDAKGVPSS